MAHFLGTVVASEALHAHPGNPERTDMSRANELSFLFVIESCSSGIFCHSTFPDSPAVSGASAGLSAHAEPKPPSRASLQQRLRQAETQADELRRQLAVIGPFIWAHIDDQRQRSFVRGTQGRPAFRITKTSGAVLSWRPVKRALSIGSPHQKQRRSGLPCRGQGRARASGML
jgi:hypothetical protein